MRHPSAETPFPIRPMFSRVIVRKVTEAKIGSIWMPEKLQEKPQEGIVVAVGPGEMICNEETHVRIPVPVEVGQRVMFTKYSGCEVEWDGQKYIILLADDIMVVLP